MRIRIHKEHVLDGSSRVSVEITHSLSNEGQMVTSFVTNDVIVLDIDGEPRRDIDLTRDPWTYPDRACGICGDESNHNGLPHSEAVRDKNLWSLPGGATVSTGTMVEIIHKTDQQKYPRRTTGKFLELTDNDVLLSLRPNFGTTSFRIDEIIEASKVPASTAIVVNERVQ